VSRRFLLLLPLVLGVHVLAAPSAHAAEGWTAPATLWGVAVDHPWNDTAAALDCGGAGQVACIKDFVYVGPYKGCNTNRLNNVLNFCVACGGVGQITCEFGPTCNAGGRPVAGFCVNSGYSAEPTPNVSVMPTLTQSATGPVRGIVDMHAHQFSNLGFGGVVFWGAPYDAGGINEALPWCDYTWKFSTKMALTGAAGPTVPFLGYEVHGPPPVIQLAANPIGIVMGEGLHDVGGTGTFSGWPHHKTYTHQQMYYKWVERAFLGGVRMMVQLAVSNEALCGMSKIRSDFTCDDMEAVDKQIQATKDLEAAIDLMDDGLDNDTGWYRIAYSASEARQHIRDGAMAVVLGVEVDSLFGCKPGVSCSATKLREQLEKYHALGVRHVFPIHQFDNGFGGAAVFRDELNSANRIVAGHHFQVRDCSAQGYTYNVKSSVATDFLALLLHGAELPDQAYYDQFAADCNATGLTATGETLINTMMDMGFIIDVDHMSRLMLDDVLTIAQSRNYPLVSGHSTPRGGQTGDEFSLTDAQMTSLRQLGGMVSAINPRGDCGTSAVFSYHYRHLVSGMQQQPGDRFAAVGLATDMNGFGGSTGPRFGNPDCPGTPGTELQYPFTGVMGGRFDVQNTGDRNFDFNTQGLAHYGLLADFFADVKANFLTEAELEPLLNSAESYIRMWARTNPGGTTPTVRAVVTGTQDPRGFAYVTNVSLKWEVTGVDGYDLKLTGCADRVISQDTSSSGQTFTCTAEAYQENSDHSHYVVGAKSESINIRRDTTPPTVAWGTLPWTPTAGWYNKDVAYPFTVADVTTGVEGGTNQTLVFTAEGLALTGTVTVSDYAGNSATYTSPPVNIDRTAPEIQYLSMAPAANTAGWHRENPTLTWLCADALSGPVALEVHKTLFAEGEGRTLIGQCTDKAGNAVSDSRTGLNLDRTAPTLEWSAASPAANAAGWHRSDVTLAFSTADALSGVADTSHSSPLMLTAEGAAVTGTVTVTDVAGNAATFTSPAARIDKTAPDIAYVSHLPAANTAGWNREDPTLTWACTDGLSGVVAPEVSRTLTTEGAGQTLTGLCADLAGNNTADTRAGLNLDKTLPTLTWMDASPAANAAGWHNTDVAFAFTTADAISGVAGTSLTSPLVLTNEGAAITGVVSVTDLAGNTATFTSPSVRIDKTAPVITCVADPAVIWPPNGKLIPVTVDLSLTDALSNGVSYVMTEASSNEPGAATDIVGFTVSGQAVRGAVRAQRDGRGTGRIYTLSYEGMDLAGNTASCSTTVTVPHNRGRGGGR
jgi:microsomal dipeptidase-like Zn-dependent dipeptidase